MICSNCGKQIELNAKFCRFCGEKQEEIKPRSENLIEDHSASKHELIYAGFMVRLGAYLFDYALIALIFVCIALLIGTQSYNALISKHSTISSYVVLALFNMFFLSSWSKTPGKALYGLTVLNKNGLTEVSTGTAIKRSILQILSTLFFGIGYWNMGADKYHQAFHDKQAGTVVVRKKKNLLGPIILSCLSFLLILYLFALASS